MKKAFLFSGQGSQYPGMMKDIADTYDSAKSVFRTADDSLGREISTICFEGTQEELSFTHNTQPCVLAADLAAFRAIRSAGISPDAVAGFSLGEYAALVAANVIDIKDALPVVQKRADLMQSAVPVGEGAMAAVMKLTNEEIESLCKEVEGYVVPANYNCPGQIVVSGTSAAVEGILEIAKEKKIRAMKLPVSAPFHCELMKSAAEQLESTLTQIRFNVPCVPLFMNVDACEEKMPDKIREKLILQAMSPVRWEQTLRNMRAFGIDTFVELGPGKTLTGFVRKTFKDDGAVRVYNVTDLESLEATVTALASEE